MSIAATPTPSKGISDVLMNKKKTVFLNLSKCNSWHRWQYNAIVNYMITKKFGVKAAYI